MIQFKKVSKQFGTVPVLQDIDLHIATGEVVVICGPSGSGKSTLIRSINRLEEIDAGEILVDGLSVHDPSRSLNALRREIGFLFQQFNLYPHLNVLDNITLAPRRLAGQSRAAAEARAVALLEQVGLSEKQAAFPANLSGGQQQRVAIARALALSPRILLFDEPTSALDPEMVGEVLTVIRQLAHQGITLVVVTHEMGFAREVADRIVFVDKGRILEQATPAAFFRQPSHPRARQFLQQLTSPLHLSEAST
ncbi:amino acid ABC transporter ATP-binding protein [Paludibacterium sp.]|uniref:amino acid ABC transporter ATP-binding protein n=1 Tax=Paludibacterium sp. TaxID=1917523 RepID=UPI0025E408FF|nr:amino acid ABC transporter ATP-binding protein [Paludibacterium sp.]MBV8648670.1 amino acid ABC transporter ATP-binding protein [Paludibacterium sp.]